MIVQALMFYVFAAVAVAGAVMVISARNPVHSVLYLILVFFNAAGLFLLLGAEFLAMMLVIVYVGAVAVLFLFVVMMLDINTLRLREGFLQYLPTGAVVGLILLVELAMAGGGWVFASDVEELRAVPVLSEISNTEALGRVMYTDYLYPFQTAGVVLLVAMVGSIMLTLRRRPDARRQNIAAQLARHKKDTLEIKKVPSGGGI
ncbi:MAG: NADH-quinone oxidoreductase subunit J [Alphaproteobacteria bacterium]|nr:NADH-quinone oxidoreductase subunit J [Alphaproteobacteria bacterium]MBF0130358.1 NADH-quinone oxidoreductase subunit J [Alphaproteobacteria bacterium]